VIVEAHGIPLAVTLTGGDRDDVTHVIPPFEAVAPIRGKRGRSLRRPKQLHADRGPGLGVHRWVVEGAVALLHWFRRLRIRWEIRDDAHQAFITLGWVRHTHSDRVPTAQS
jgi:hypothetical protein